MHSRHAAAAGAAASVIVILAGVVCRAWVTHRFGYLATDMVGTSDADVAAFLGTPEVTCEVPG